MPDSAPDRLNTALSGRYAIERELGEGGMATVYLAEDLKHARKVALKVLKPELAAVVGAERFLAEIKTTANLHHPNILPLFDSGEADGFLFYVMPFVEGDTLRDRLDREKQLPVDEAVAITTAVANALQHAHDRGVIHRDIKPANILLQDGQPVVADFGIALAVGAAGGARLTETGLSVGTPYYMSPEQATGDQRVGPTSDVYSLGAVLYEALVGDPPYTGSTAQVVLGKIIQGAPVSATEIRNAVPANVDGAIRKALEKLPADRFSRVQDFAHALTDSSFRYGAGGAPGPDGDVRRWKRLAGGLAALWVLATAWGGWGLLNPPEVPPRPVARFSSPFRPGQGPSGVSREFTFSVSPDGASLVYQHLKNGQRSLFVRRWDDLEATALPGSESGDFPSISPDGQEVVFRTFDPNQRRFSLRVASLQGGSGRELLSDSTQFFARWARDGFIYVNTDSGVARVGSKGGAFEQVTRDTEQTTTEFWSFLPDHRTALGIRFEGREAKMAAFDLVSGETTLLGVDGGIPQYLAPGYLVYWTRDSTVTAVPFDADKLEVTGDPVTMIEGVWEFDVSDSGDLFYWGPARPNTVREFIWVSRTGQVTPVDPGWTFDAGVGNEGWSLSPDGRRLAYRELRDHNYDIWIKDLDTGPLSRLTFHPREERMPRWTPDGEGVTFLSARNGRMDVFSKAADGTGDAQPLFRHTTNLAQALYGPEGEWLVMRTGGQAGMRGARDIVAVRPGVDSVATPLLTADYDEAAPAVSPDGRWLAYGSQETGTYEVYVRPFPDVEAGRWQVSFDGGVEPVWSRDGKELFYVNGAGEVVAVRFDTTSGFRIMERAPLFSLPPGADRAISFAAGGYDVTPDGQRFIMARSLPGAEDAPTDEWVLVQNFVEDLKRLVRD